MAKQGSQRLLATAGVCIAASVLGSAAPEAHAVTTYALTDNNFLVRFDSATPQILTGVGVIKGLDNEFIGQQDLIGIDFRPSDGKLYAVSAEGLIYTIDPNTAAATQLGTPGLRTLFADSADSTDPFTSLSGSRFGFDFNPVADFTTGPSLRILSNTRQNLRVNVNAASLAATTTDTPPVVGSNIIDAAYTNSIIGFAPPPSTTLYGIDSVNDTLVQFTNPNAGTFVTVGPLGIDVSSLSGFDIAFDGVTNVGYAALQDASNGVSRFYSINLVTGAANLIGTIEGGDFIDGIAVVPEPTSVALLGIGAIGLLARRRRA
jgi:hypothetical protein